MLEEGGIIYQETRHWEPSRKRTVVMRVKETADDYRLFPDPDLAPFDLSDEFIDRCRAKIPELPDAKRDRFEHDLACLPTMTTHITPMAKVDLGLVALAPWQSKESSSNLL